MTTESQLQLDVPHAVLEAHERCQDYLLPTPLEYSRYLSDRIEGDVWLKLDSMQITSSFKFRGAINKILTLTEEELAKRGGHSLYRELRVGSCRGHAHSKAPRNNLRCQGYGVVTSGTVKGPWLGSGYFRRTPPSCMNRCEPTRWSRWKPSRRWRTPAPAAWI